MGAGERGGDTTCAKIRPPKFAISIGDRTNNKGGSPSPNKRVNGSELGGTDKTKKS